MKKSTLLKCYRFTLCFFAMFSIFITIEASAADYYITPSGGSDSSDGLSQNTPWAKFSYAMTKLLPGDTLYIMDGTYTEPLTVTISGASGAPITFKALNESKVTINGRGKRVPVWVQGQSYIDIEDIIATDSDEAVVYVSTTSSYVNIRRVLAHDAGTGNWATFTASSSSYVLFEDCAAWGEARKMFLAISSSYITMRRCWGRFESWNGVGGDSATGLQFYRTTDSLMENCVFVRNPSATRDCKSFNSVRVGSNNDNDRNKFYGNVVHGDTGIGAGFRCDGNENTKNLTGHRWYHNVVIETDITGVAIDVGDDTIIENMTVIGVSDKLDKAFSLNRSLTAAGGFSLAATLKNSSLHTGSTGVYINTGSVGYDSFTSSYVNVYNCTTPYTGTTAGTGSSSINPNYDTTTYGYGAYLMASKCDLAGTGEGGADIGAEVLFKYTDGVVSTTDRLWPWPMEDRISTATGISVTWDTDGGIWKTLDGVYTGSQSFNFSLSNSGNVSAIQSSAVSNTITASLVSGSTQPVSYSVSGLPSGVTASFFQTPCFPDCSTALTINTSGSTPTGTYTIAVTGTGGGISKTTSFGLTVNPYILTQNVITSVKTTTPVVVDGNLSDSVWSQANYVEFSNPSRSDNQVKVLTVYDDTNLYFAYEVEDPQLEALNQGLWNDDGAEIFIDTQNNKTANMDDNDYHFTVNINDLTSGGNIITKTSTSQNGYTMEISIPWASINTTPTPNMTMGLLLGNNDRENGNSSQFVCQNLIDAGPFARPNLWGDIVLSSQVVDTTAPAPPSDLILVSIQ